MKTIALILFGVIAGLPTSAQTVTPVESSWNDPLLPFYFIGVLIFFVFVLIVIVAFYLLRVMNILGEQAARENAAKSGVKYVAGVSWWNKIWTKLNQSVPLEQEKTIEMAHSYDGIRELDNHLPPWWKWLFYGTIAWAVIYMVIYHFSYLLPLSEQEYQNEMTLAEDKARQLRASQPQTVIDENALEFTNDAALIEKGKSVFASSNCGSCHRNDGGGNAIGPNLTDKYWLHGGGLKNIFTTIKNGFVEKGMPAWGKSLSPQELRDVTYFVISLQETIPADAKAPQGVFEQQQTIEVDSVKVQAAL